MEQVFGVRMRDVTAYRPLIEYCLALPTEQFVRDGETRRLARRMGRGRLPEPQRTNRLYGEHNVDWHLRLTPKLAQLRQRLSALRSHPYFADVIDVDRALAAIDAWPARSPRDAHECARLSFYLPAICYVADFVDFASARNAA